MKALALVTSLLCDLEQVSLPLFRSFVGLFAYQMRFCFYLLREEMLSFSFSSFFKQIIIYIKKMDKCKLLTQELAYFLQ